MAPPPHRRPGFSRRAQFSIFAGYVLAVGAMLAAVLLLLAARFDPRGFDALRIAASELVAPVARPINSARRHVGSTLSRAGDYWNAAATNAALRRELAAQRRKAVRAEVLERENAQLRRAIGLVESSRQPVAVAQLMGSTLGSTRRQATLSAGSTSGVRTGMPVRAPEGLIGRVIAAGPSVSQVLLVSDTDNVVPVVRLSDGMPAFASGTGDGAIAIRPVNIGENSLKPGDLFVTSGSGGLYSPGIPAARVRTRTSDGAIAAAAADPARARFVVVERAYRPPAARIAPRPAPPPAAVSVPSAAPSTAPTGGGE